MLLWRPVGLAEMSLIFLSDMQRFPPRLPQQPIFYPVLERAYAEQIARDWNTKEDPYAGYVLKFEISDEYAIRFEPQTVGGSIHRELWIPAEQLSEFNDQLTGPIKLEFAFFSERFRGYIPNNFGLRNADAYEQLRKMIGTMKYSGMDFLMEISANAATFFLNFPFWKSAGATRLNLDEQQYHEALLAIDQAWATSPRASELLKDAALVP